MLGYVKDRDEWLQRGMKTHDITRDAAKELFLRVGFRGSYLSGCGSTT